MNHPATPPVGQMGWIVTWKVPSTVLVEQLRKSLLAAGLDTDLATDLKDSVAIRRALRQMKAGRVIRAYQVTPEEIRFQLTVETTTAGGVDYDREADIVLHRETGKLSGDKPELVQTAEILLQQVMIERHTSDLTRIVQRLIEANRGELIPIREQGGAYFVPQRHARLVDQARILLNGIGGRLSTYSVRLGCEHTEAAVAQAIMEHLEQQLGELEEFCDSVNTESKPGIVRLAVERREVKIRELRQRLSTYASLLGTAAVQINSALEKTERELLRKIAETAAPTA